MAVDDLWHLSRPGKNAAPCGEHGKLVASGRHGRGKRYRVRYLDPEGRDRTQFFDKKGDAERYDLKVRADVARGDFIDPGNRRLTVREYGEQWRQSQPHRPNTAARVKSQFEKHIYPALGSRPISAVRATEVQAFISAASIALAPGTVRVLAATLSAVFGAARRDRLIPYDPTDALKLPDAPRSKVVPLTVDQVEALIAGLAPRYRGVGIVAAGTGMRQGEVFGLQVHDVDFLRRVIRVDRQVQPTGVGPLKNRSAYRTIPVGAVVIEALAAHLAEYPSKPEGFIFRAQDGNPLHRGYFVEPWRLARRAAGLPTAGMHELRHFYASALIRAGLSVKVVSERLGHTNAAMTLNVYSHLWPDDEDRSRQAIDDLFQSPVRLGRLASVP